MKRKWLLLMLGLLAAGMLFATGEGAEKVFDRSLDEGHLTMYFPYLSSGDTQDSFHGDCTLMVSPEGLTLMIDSGHPKTKEQLFAFLDKLGIDHLDYYVMSHPHVDHVGSFPALAKQYPVGNLIKSYLTDTSIYYRNVLSSAASHNIPVTQYETGATFDFGSYVKVLVLSPDKDTVIPEKPSISFVNSSSLCLKFTYGETTALFCGDLYNMGERSVMNRWGDELKSDIAKANHHGGDTSNQSQWVKAVSPKLCVVLTDGSCSVSVYNRYVKNGAKVLEPPLHGNMKLVLGTQHDYTVYTEKSAWMDKEN